MKVKFLLFTAFLFVGFSSQGFGQLLNGDFSQGGTHWDWFGDDSPIGSNYCINGLAPSSARVSGGVANGHPGSAIGQTGQRSVCGAIRQSIQIPPGTQIKFDRKLGRIYDTPSNSVTLKVNIITNQASSTIYTGSGTNQPSTCQHFNECPTFHTNTADVSAFWGQNVTLEFLAVSSYTKNSLGMDVTLPTQAYIDNIEFEPLPPVSTFPTSGMWYNPDRSGHGIDISRSSTGQYQVMWFTYLPSGTPIWYMSSLQSMTQGEWNATLNKVTRDPVSGNTVQQPAGTAKITMLANDELIFEWNLNAQSGSPSTGAERMVHLHGGGAYSGMWYEPAFSGWGFTLDVEGSGSGATTVATAYFYTASGQPVWAQGTANGDLNQQVTFSMDTFVGSGLCPGCAGQPTSATPSPAGTLHMRQLDSSPKGYSNIQTTGGVTWVRGSSSNLITYARLTVP